MNFDGFLEPVDLTDGIPEGAITIRPSTVKSADLCPARVGYRDTPGYRDRASQAMSWGTMVHDGAERVLNGANPLEVFRPAVLLDRWAVLAHERDEFDLHSAAPPERLSEWADEASEALHLWHKTVYPQLPLSDVDDIEVTLTRGLGVYKGRPVVMYGTPDLVLDGEIHDWKTAGRAWSEGRANFEAQPSAYTYLKWGFDEEPHKFVFWVYDRSKFEWTPIEVWRDVNQVSSWVMHAWMRTIQIEEGITPATPTMERYGKTVRGWYCGPKYCPAWDVCDFKWLGDDVDEGTPIDVKAGWQ